MSLVGFIAYFAALCGAGKLIYSTICCLLQPPSLPKQKTCPEHLVVMYVVQCLRLATEPSHKRKNSTSHTREHPYDYKQIS